MERSRALLTEKRAAGARLEDELAALREDEVDITLAIRQKQGANAALQARGLAAHSGAMHRVEDALGTRLSANMWGCLALCKFTVVVSCKSRLSKLGEQPRTHTAISL